MISSRAEAVSFERFSSFPLSILIPFLFRSLQQKLVAAAIQQVQLLQGTGTCRQSASARQQLARRSLQSSNCSTAATVRTPSKHALPTLPYRRLLCATSGGHLPPAGAPSEATGPHHGGYMNPPPSRILDTCLHRIITTLLLLLFLVRWVALLLPPLLEHLRQPKSPVEVARKTRLRAIATRDRRVHLREARPRLRQLEPPN